jgi:hypothetical protein
MPDFADIARSLLYLEVNTLICDGMTAEKMPVAGEALIRVAQTYQRFLCQRLVELEKLGAPVDGLPRIQIDDAAPVSFIEWAVHSGDLPTFSTLRRVAHLCQQARRAPDLHYGLNPEDDVVVDRVLYSCDQIKGIFLGLNQKDVPVDQQTVALAEKNQAPMPDLGRDALVKLRKIWEFGTEKVAMQTVIQIDGDVISRVQAGRDNLENQVLHHIHRGAVEVSFQHWSFLVKTAESFAESVLGRFFPAG